MPKISISLPLWECTECNWQGEEHKLLIETSGGGQTHWYQCPRCNSTEVNIIDEEEL
jgi:hypothetical protein